MTPAEVKLVRRFMAAGAPVPESCRGRGSVGIWLERERRWHYVKSGETTYVSGLAYYADLENETEEVLPALTDPSWLGWTLAEVRRRGFRLAIATGRDGGYSVSCGREHPTEWVEWHPSREAALVALLKATTPLHPARDRDSSPA